MKRTNEPGSPEHVVFQTQNNHPVQPVVVNCTKWCNTNICYYHSISYTIHENGSKVFDNISDDLPDQAYNFHCLHGKVKL